MDDAVRTARRIAVLATLDTKADEAALVARTIASRGHVPVIYDLGLLGTSPAGVDVSRAQILAAAGSAPAEGEERTAKMARVGEAAGRLLEAAVRGRTLDGVIALGGGTGSWVATEAMRPLPIGFPKLMVTTFVHGDGRSDIAVLPTVADIAGVNRLLGPILVNAAAAISGMAEQPPQSFGEDRRTVAMTMFGVTTTGGDILRHLLEQAGCEVVVFHATGAGGASMEDLARQGMFDAIVDWTTSEVTDELVGGICTSGPTRLDAAAELGIPQVIVPGAIDVINVHAPIPERFAGRTFHMHLPTVPLLRTSAEESERIGGWIADKLNRSTGPVAVVIPRGGFSSLDIAGGPFEDADADAAFERGLRDALRTDIPVRTETSHINDEAFAAAVADTVLALLAASPAQRHFKEIP